MQIDPPETFLCGITKQVMRDSVMDTEGNTFDSSRTTESPSNPKIYTETSMYTIQRGTGYGDSQSLVTITSTAEKVPPKHIILLVDTSGSMLSSASTGTHRLEESDNLTLLCIVKHAVNTVISMLRPQDYVSVVSFNSEAQIIGNVVQVDDSALIESLKRDLVNLTPAGMTNIWGGLEKALDVATKITSDIHTTIMVLTDGVPQPEPPRGTPAMLRDKLAGVAESIVVCTFGFGYSLDSVMLREIAEVGNGTYSFTPDSTFTGTVFIHAVASILSTLEPVALPGVLRGGVLMKQPRSVLCGEIQQDSLGNPCATMLMEGGVVVKGDTHRVVTMDSHSDVRFPLLKLLLETEAESKVKYCLQTLLRTFQWYDFAGMKSVIHDTVRCLNSLCDELKSDSSAQNNPDVDSDIQNMIKDITGQVTTSVSKKEWWSRWGFHYIGSLLSAYESQTCNNFKDPGVQNKRFCGPFVTELRDKGEEIFMSLPPPVAPTRMRWGRSSISSYVTGLNRSTVSMRRYHDRDAGGCFTGGSVVRLIDGSVRPFKDLDSTCIVESFDTQGNLILTGSRVRCVVKLVNIDMVVVNASLTLGVTLTHPIWHKDMKQWIHPSRLSTKIFTRDKTDVVYNVVLEDGAASFTVGGVKCVSLGHMIENDAIATHDYLGAKIIKCHLTNCRGWNMGHITMSGKWLNRDEHGSYVSVSLESEI